MPAEWPQVAIADLIAQGVLFIGDGYRAKNEELGTTGLPFARVANIGAAGVLDLRGADRFPEKDLHKVGNKISQPGDIAFTSKGTVGRFIFVKEETERFVYSPQVSFWRVLDQTTIWPRFLLFWMQGREFREQVNGLKGQTDMADYVSLGDQRRMKITLPPFPVQRRIAEILGRLDDKIEVNRRINHTLAAMAQALYRHWFVEFGPFRDGEFVESELGVIPKGWTVGKVDDLLELAYGKGLTERNRVPGPYAVVGSSGEVGRHTQPLVDGPGIVVGRKGTIGRLTWVAGDFWPIDTTYYVVPRRQVYGLEFLYYLLGSLDLPSRNNDSAVPGLNRNEVHRLPVVVPPDEILAQFVRIVKRWLDMMHQSNVESAKLAAIRDYLLPKLLAGEIRGDAVESLVGESALTA